ncbi:MAG: hypothetical protein ABIP53_03520, partial [Candidatus Limnocylindrales bacterium]
MPTFAVAALLGILIGLSAKSACSSGPVGSPEILAAMLLVGALTLLLVIVAVLFAILRRGSIAPAALALAAAGLAGGLAAGLSFAPPCPDPREVSANGTAA